MSSKQQRYQHTPAPSHASLIGRQRAGQLAPNDTAKALQAARACPDAWYRVQALASVAEYADQNVALSILEEAAREAQSCHDAYGAVAVMAWPIGVAFRQGQLAFAGRELKKCLERASEIEPRASQAYALEILWHACFAEQQPGHANAVWRRILELCHPDRSWRAARLYLHIAEIQHGRNRSAAAVIRAMPPGKTRSWLERRFRIT
jgi:hypothetical protein